LLACCASFPKQAQLDQWVALRKRTIGENGVVDYEYHDRQRQGPPLDATLSAAGASLRRVILDEHSPVLHLAQTLGFFDIILVPRGICRTGKHGSSDGSESYPEERISVELT